MVEDGTGSLPFNEGTFNCLIASQVAHGMKADQRMELVCPDEPGGRVYLRPK